MTALRFFDRVRLGNISLRGGESGQLREVLMQQLEIALGEIFDVDQPVAGALQRRDQLIELQMNRERVLVLRSLEQLSSIAS